MGKFQSARERIEAGDGEAIAELGRFYEELKAKLDAGEALDADGSLALFLLADELCWLRAERPVADDCLELYETALRVEHLLSPGDRAELWLGLAEELRHAGRPDEARKLLERARDLRGADVLRPSILSELADLERAAGRLDLAEQILPTVSSALEVPGVHPQERALVELELLELRMRLALDKGLPDLLARLLADYETRVPEDDHQLLVFRIQLLQATEQFDRIVEQLEPRVAAVRGRDPELRAELQVYLAMAEAERARLRSLPLARSEELFTEVLESEDSPPLFRRQAAIRLAASRIRSGYPYEALALLEEVRAEAAALPTSTAAWVAALEARAALDAQPAGKALDARMEVLAAAYEALLAEWAAIPARRGGLGFLHNLSRRDVLGELVRLRLATGGEAGPSRALEDVLEARSLGSLARELADGPAVTLAEIQQELVGTRRGALVFLPSTERSFVFAVDADRVTCHPLPPLKDWNPDRHKLALALRQPPPPGRGSGSGSRREIERLAAALAGQLLTAEVQERLGAWDEVYVEGLDLAGYLPFELLPLELEAGTPMGQVLPLAYLPSLNVGCLLLRRARRDPRPQGRFEACVVAAPASGRADLEDIPWSEEFAAPLRRAYGREGLVLRTGAEATRATLTDSELMAVSVLELVLHGLYDPERERPGGMAFEPSGDGDGSVWCDDVDELSGIPPLVFLAICSASRGPLRTGDDGVSHLGGSFFRADAHTVVLSPIDLEVHATMGLAEIFHDRVGRRGESPARAMVAARRALVEQGTYDHPYFHSTLHVVGLGHLPLFPERASEAPSEEEPPLPASVLLLPAALLIAVAASLWVLRRSRRTST